MHIRIIETKTNKVVKDMGPVSERKAKGIASGASINLNHDDYHIDIVDDDGE